MKNKYIITIVPADSGKVKKITVSTKGFRFLAVGGAFLVIFFLFLFVHFIYTTAQNQQVARLKQEVEILKEVNAKYQKTADNLEEKLNYFSDKAKKLALLVGADISIDDDPLGIGGSDYVFTPYAEYLNKDLDSMNERAQKLFEGYEKLSKIYKNKNDVLRKTPSIWPVKGFITDGFGYRIDPFTGKRAFHKGIDISARRGTPVVAPADGIVTMAGKTKGYGNFVVINHQNNLETRYGHLRDIFVKRGQIVKRGDVIGTVGNTGRSTGPHLHFEVRVNGKAVNPRDYIVSEIMHF
ncbi:peptidase M23 [Thermotomaculum hydrothermale]|uniref:Peptidase M23 n=1 Tax=Thermotomaculum hydrothermale TaxID=981385 RepID=A0A7R6SXQ5_9BACT|nr:M23 family metallopeptidase [Thermotomaculum hydrothermale]BBB31741.1 peptidase M23 [Thermotomaculum hydrothermale]